LPILVKFQEVLEDVKHNRPEVREVLIHYPQLPLWRGDLFPYNAGAPPDDAEHEDDTTNAEVFHD
jgi:hypothetical protein